MEKQPTAILVLFTDYLDNRDSIAFFRLSSSLWSSHRSPQGRYRLKPPNEKEKFPRSSKLPFHAFSSYLSSPSAGNFFFTSLCIEDSSDFPGENEEIPQFLETLDTLAIHIEAMLEILNSGQKLPNSVENVSFYGNSSDRKSFKELTDFLPEGIKKLDLRKCDRIETTRAEEINFTGFPRLFELQFWQTFSVPFLPGIFPASLRKLSFGYWFNESLDSLPDCLEELSLEHSRYNQPLPSRLPRNLKILILGALFNQPIASLPEGLKILKIFSGEFRQPFNMGCFPHGIEEIILKLYYYNHRFLPGIFPETLKKFSVRNPIYSQRIPSGVLPNSLETLDLYFGSHYSLKLPPLPPGVQSLTYSDFFIDFPALPTTRGQQGKPKKPPINQPSSALNPRYRFPSSLEAIEFSDYFNEPLSLGIFPNVVKTIQFGLKFDKMLSKGIFPAGLKKIILSHAFAQKLPVGIFPPGIHTVELGNRYSHSLEVGLFPSSVRKLRISTEHPLPLGVFPEGLESIEFNPTFSQSLLPGIFPSSLRRLIFLRNLEISTGFQGDFLPGVLPQFLCEFELPSSFSGYFPSSAVPPYFLDDFPSLHSSVPHRLKSFNSCSADLFSRLGGDGRFFLKTFRLAISSSSRYFLAEPLDGVGDSFVVSEHWIEKVQKS